MDSLLKIYKILQYPIVITGITLFVIESFFPIFMRDYFNFTWQFKAVRFIEAMAFGTCFGAFREERRKSKSWDKMIKQYAKRHPTDTGIFD